MTFGMTVKNVEFILHRVWYEVSRFCNFPRKSHYHSTVVPSRSHDRYQYAITY